jgi:hypothetical protein
VPIDPASRFCQTGYLKDGFGAGGEKVLYVKREIFVNSLGQGPGFIATVIVPYIVKHPPMLFL